MYTTNAKVRPPRQNIISTLPQCKCHSCTALLYCREMLPIRILIILYLDLFIFFLYGTVNFSYPSLEEPKPLIPPQPEPEITPEPEEPSPSVLMNGFAPAEPPTLKTSAITDRLPDAIDPPLTGSTTSVLDPNKKIPTAGTCSQSPATAKAFPQVSNQLYHLILWKLKTNKHLNICLITSHNFSPFIPLC